MHHPLGLWLTPMLLAVAAAVPVAWNAPGVAADIPDWLAAPIAAAVEASSHVSVRDEISAQMLSTLVPDAPVRVVPDTGFGIGRLLDAKPSQELEELVARLGGERGYVVVQPSAELGDVAGAVRGVLAAARERGLAAVELPFSPGHGDRTGTLPGLGETVSPPDWPGPRLIAEILAGAEAVIAQSFRAGAGATASGVPLYRPPSPPGWKYEALEGHEGVHLLREGSGDGPGSGSYEDFGRRSPAATVRERIAQLSAHWDAVAATARAERRRDAPLTPAALGLIAALPHQLHAHEELLQERSAERERVIAERLHAAEARLAASEAAAAARIENLRSASTALLAQKEDLTTWVARLTDERTEAAARTAALDEVRNRKIVRLGLLLTRPLLWLRRWRGRPSA